MKPSRMTDHSPTKSSQTTSPEPSASVPAQPEGHPTTTGESSELSRLRDELDLLVRHHELRAADLRRRGKPENACNHDGHAATAYRALAALAVAKQTIEELRRDAVRAERQDRIGR